MDIETAAGRLLLVGFEQNRFDDGLARLLAEVRPGGTIFFQHNVAGATEFAALVKQVAAALVEAAPTGGFPLLAMDLEGGAVDRLGQALAPFPSARAVAATADDPFMRHFGALVGEALAGFGLNVDLAPVLDLATSQAEPILGARTISSDPKQVARFARNFLAGLTRFGVLGCGKHFPGLGSATRDTHLETAEVSKTAEQLWEEDLLPFRELHAELPLLMVGHAWYPALHPEGTPPRPASLSREVIGLLRERIGFRGVVAADDLEMGGVLSGRSMEEAALAAVEAGCDLLLVCRSVENIRAAHRALAGRALEDAAFAARLEEAAGRVETLQQTLRRAAEERRQGTSTDWRRLTQAIRHLHAEAEHMGALAASMPRYTAAAARPQRGRRPGGGGGRRREAEGRRGGRGGPRRGGPGRGQQREDGARRGFGDRGRDRGPRGGDRRPPRDS